MPADHGGRVVADILGAAVVELDRVEGRLEEAGRAEGIAQAAEAYSAQFERRFGTLRIPGMAKPVPLRSIYVHINILEKLTARWHASIEDLEEFFDRDRRHFGLVRESRAGLETIDRIPKVLLLGKPGAGKSTFLKHIGLQALDGALSETRIPVFVSLKHWSDSTLTLPAYVAEQFASAGLPRAVEVVEHVLRSGRFLLLLDGLDEVGDAGRAIRAIRETAERYHANSFVIGCRIAAYNYLFEEFTDVELADFDAEQISQFVHNWFGSDVAMRENCWSELRDRPEIMELASVPLLLAMLCLAYEARRGFPNNRAELYREGVEALLRRWDESKSVRRQEPYRFLSPGRKQDLLGRIAMESLENGQYFIPRHVVEQHVATFFALRAGRAEEAEEVEPEVILSAIVAQHGLLVERAWGIYSFSHLSFQEFFAARQAVKQSSKVLSSSLLQHLLDPAWREVILLAAGMMVDADRLVEAIVERIGQMEREPELGAILAGAAAVPGAIRRWHFPYTRTEARHHARIAEAVKSAALRIEAADKHYWVIWGRLEQIYRRCGVGQAEVLDASLGERVYQHAYADALLRDCLSVTTSLGRRGRSVAEECVSASAWRLVSDSAFLFEAGEWADHGMTFLPG